MNPLHLQPERTAFVAIDLQQGIVGMPGVPHPTSTVVRHAARLADALRRAGAFIVFVHVDFVDGKDALQPVAEKQLPAKPMDNWAELIPDLHVQPGDHIVVKRGFGAFFGTDLDLQLRRRGIDHPAMRDIDPHRGRYDGQGGVSVELQSNLCDGCDDGSLQGSA